MGKPLFIPPILPVNGAIMGAINARNYVDRCLATLRGLGANSGTLAKLEADAKESAITSPLTFEECFDRLYWIEFDRLSRGNYTPSEAEEIARKGETK